MVLCTLLFIGMGAWQLLAPLDVLWARKEHYLLARGLAPQRSDAWESSVRVTGWIIIAFGVVVILILLPILTRASVPKMSGVTINSHELTQQEWDDCHHDFTVCASQYMNGQH